MRVGLTGGIGSGKSAVAACWAELGALVIDADASAREAVEPGSSGLVQIAQRWPSVITASGTLDRAALAHIVFADESARIELESIVHPAVRAIGIAREAEAQPGQMIVHMVPLLFEVGYDQRCDMTVVVIAADELRIRRVCARDGLHEDDVRARMNRQIDPAEARNKADIVIENNGNLETLLKAAGATYRRLCLR
jgi:dephospho-CoA kinase